MAFAPKIGDWQSAPATASRPVFAIGDIHGRNDLFEPLIAAILRVVDEEKLEKVALVTLGDYVDRGPRASRSSRRCSTASSIPRSN